MKLIPDLVDRVRRPVPRGEDAHHQLLHRRPAHRRAVQPRPAQRRRARPRPTSPPPASPTPRSSPPRPSSTSSTTSASRRSRTRATTTSTPSRAPGTPDAIEEGGNRGYKTRYKGGYFPVPPVDHFADLRDQITLELDEVGLQVERAHHEVGTAGQAEINYRFDTLLKRGDELMMFKYIVKNVAWANGKTATFMPKPLFGDNGSGMHCHQSLWKDGEPLFYDERGYGGLSDIARWYIGGLLNHAPSLLAFTNPTVNSYHRLVPGFEAPVNLVYSARNRSACVRIPITGLEPEGQAHRVPRSRPVGEPVPGLLGAADGRPRRHQEPDRAAGTRSTRTSTSCRPRSTRRSRRSPARCPRCSTRSRPTTSYLSRAACSPTDLIETWIELQARQRDRPDPAAPAPARVRALLRRVRSSVVATARGEEGALTGGHAASGPLLRHGASPSSLLGRWACGLPAGPLPRSAGGRSPGARRARP